MRQRFVSSFVIQTDATFNINELNMLLSILVGIINTISSFPLAYIFIFLSLKKHSNLSMPIAKSFFFWNDFPGPIVMLGNFLLGLSVAMVRKVGISMVKAGMSQF